jgi:hypothetical protein
MAASNSTVGAGFVIFTTLRVERLDEVAGLVETIAREVDEWLRHVVGFRSSRIHVSQDGTTVVHGSWWADETGPRTGLRSGSGTGVPRDPAAWPGPASVTEFRGVRIAHIDGPAAGERPGVLSVATRTVDGHESARALADLLLRSGDWKRQATGFISATAYVSLDGTQYLNYPQWVDETAFRAYMADPRLSEGQVQIGHVETAPPVFVMCTVVADRESATG